MKSRIKITAGVIIATAMLGTLVPVANSARAEETEFCDPIETVSPIKKPSKAIKSKASRKSTLKRASGRKVVAAKPGVKKMAKLVKAKPKKPLSFADRLRNKARRTMLASLDPKKAKMCRPRVPDQLGLLDKILPAAGQLPAAGGTPFRFTPDTSAGPLSSVTGGNRRVIDPSRISAFNIPSGGGGGGGGRTNNPSDTPTPTTTTPTVTATPPTTTANIPSSPGTNTPTVTTNPIAPLQPGDSGPSTGSPTPVGGGTRCDMLVIGGGIPGGALNPMPEDCGSPNLGGGSTSGGGSSGGAQVPEPGVLSLMGLGLLVAGWQRRRSFR
jgi:PEP-CTERM motif